EIGQVVRVAAGQGHQIDDKTQGAGAAGLQDGDGRHEGDEDARKKLAELLDREPVEAVRHTAGHGGYLPAQVRQSEQYDVTNQVLDGDVDGPQVDFAELDKSREKHRADHAQQQQQVDGAFNGQLPGGGRLF